MRDDYKAALNGGIPLGASILCFSIISSPRWEWDFLFLLLSGCIGALFAYCCYKSSVGSLSLTKSAVVGAAVGVAAGIIYFTCSAIIYLLVANTAVVFDKESMSLVVIGLVRLAVVSGLGGLAIGLVSKLRR
jgi:hypothetical protein